MPLEKYLTLFRRADFLMTPWLIIDIANRRWHLRGPNRERSISFLPVETPAPGLFMHPLRRSGFHELNRFGNRDCRREREKNVSVICNPADCERPHPVRPGNATHIRPEPGLQVFWNARDSVLGCKHTMKQGCGVGVIGHRPVIVTSAVPNGTHSFHQRFPGT
jgi:hypothetical protein